MQERQKETCYLGFFFFAPPSAALHNGFFYIDLWLCARGRVDRGGVEIHRGVVGVECSLSEHSDQVVDAVENSACASVSAFADVGDLGIVRKILAWRAAAHHSIKFLRVS